MFSLLLINNKMCTLGFSAGFFRLRGVLESYVVPTDRIFKFLNNGNFVEAYRLAETSFSKDYDNSVAVFIYRVLHFWKKRAVDNTGKKNPVEYGDSLFEVWNKIEVKYFITVQTNKDDPFFISFKSFVFREIISVYNNVKINTGNISFKMGICYKQLGDIENAMKCLAKSINDITENSSGKLAEMADCYALLGDDSHSRIIFKEAFSGDPQSINLDYLKSEEINDLIQRVEEFGYTGNELKEWIPVYGFLWGFFSVKREMRQSESNKIRQNIKYLKSIMAMEPKDISLIKPQLIRNYLRLIEYYSLFEKNRSCIEDALINIKRLDPEIYRLYAN